MQKPQTLAEGISFGNRVATVYCLMGIALMGAYLVSGKPLDMAAISLTAAKVTLFIVPLGMVVLHAAPKQVRQKASRIIPVALRK